MSNTDLDIPAAKMSSPLHSQTKKSSTEPSEDMHRFQTNELLNLAEINKKETMLKEKMEEAIENKLLKDNSPEAKFGRQKMMFRAVYGEFMCTVLFFTPIFGCIFNFTMTEWDSNLISLAVAFIGGLQAIAVSFAFSSVSGAHFNPAVSFALWLTGKLSNRKLPLYIFAQLLASIISMGFVTAMFPGNLQPAFLACTVTPPSKNPALGQVFATEFLLTFLLTYVAFTVAFEDAERQKKDSMSFKTIADSRGLTLYASTPQSKTGFAPFSIGFTVFCLSLIGGASGGAFNPARIFGPAIYSGNWDYLWLYWIAEFLGASSAGLIVHNVHRLGLEHTSTSGQDEITAKETMQRALAGGQLDDPSVSMDSVYKST
jgi:glycerol uptake facilitator-like aquaporin